MYVIFQVLPSGWIIEPMSKDKKVHSMVTYIMQVSQGQEVNDQNQVIATGVIIHPDTK